MIFINEEGKNITVSVFTNNKKLYIDSEVALREEYGDLSNYDFEKNGPPKIKRTYHSNNIVFLKIENSEKNLFNLNCEKFPEYFHKRKPYLRIKL
jgi:hypothetical protein